MDSVSMSRNLLPASYRSMAGANLYSDKPGVLPTKGYRLGSNSPALDAGESSVERPICMATRVWWGRA